MVMPAYRLNVYGFLASHELLHEPSNRSGTVGNLGFWDQRLALHWTYTNISYFNGNPANITVAGYSAGAHSVFYQLAYDIDYPPEKRIIKRVCMLANGPGVQPKSLDEAQAQFDELLEALHISSSLPAHEKLRLLRETSQAVLRKAISKLRLHEFRAVTDGHFVRQVLFKELDDGTFARKLLQSNVQIWVGESMNEHFVYAMHRRPKNGADALHRRFLADYPRWAVDVLRERYMTNGQLPQGVKSWGELFGRIYADMQVHVTERGLVDALVRGGAGHLIYRYRIEWRSEVSWAQKHHGATHWADDVIWFFGNGRKLPAEEKRIVAEAFIDEYAKFVKGDELDWRARGSLEVRRLRSDGAIDVWTDEWWANKLDIWRQLQKACSEQSFAKPTPNL
ncbi:hypothetical protein, variant [Verruconis gallopava]|nr:hypothetical protein, variant [Verruconis gallopava]KIW04016.1 hypothetical protein, variant [Verruconis gallopava]